MTAYTFARGEWTSADGQYVIGRVRAVEYCEGPHPERYRDETGRLHTGYCEGDEPHDREIGWDIRDAAGIDYPWSDVYKTLRDAKADVERFIARQQQKEEQS